jgi:outer membrane protein assembly factor BamB
MSLYRVEPPQPPHQRSPWLITAVLVLVVAMVAGALWLFSLRELGVRLLATPTPSATPANRPTATPDFRSTMIFEDLVTQIAYLATVTRQTPERINVPVVMGGADETATALSIQFPMVGGGEPIAELTAVIDPNLALTPTPIPPPNIELPPLDAGVNPDSPLDAPTPEEGMAPGVIDTETPTPTETIFDLPTETPTFTPTPAPTVFLVEDLNGVVALAPGANSVWLRQAPRNAQTPDGTLVPGLGVRLRGRDSTGEWVYICCADGQQRWLRQVNAPPSNNSLPGNAPPNATPNDVRWLPTQPWPLNIPQPPGATPIPPDDFPMPSRDRANTGHVPTAFSGGLQLVGFGSSTGRLTTPPVVVGSYVLVASADGSIYGFNRDLIQQQLWKYNAGNVNQPMLVVDNILYYVTTRTDNISTAVAIPIGSQNPLWSVTLNIPNGPPSAFAVTGFVAYGDRLFLGVGSSGSFFVVQLDRGQGAPLVSFPVGGDAPKALAIGNQLVYVAGARLWALDVDNLELVWERQDFNGVVTPPVYAANGVLALAELYVSVNNGSTHALDANTGKQLHDYDSNGQLVTGLGFNDTMLFVVTNADLRVFERKSRGLLRNMALNGSTPGSPIVTPDKLLIVSSNGTIQFVDYINQVVSAVGSVPQAVSHASAVSGNYLFVPSEDGRVYGFVHQ